MVSNKIAERAKEARIDTKIAALETDQRIIEVIRYCITLVGIRAENMPQPTQVTVLVGWIRDTYEHETPKSIRLAFDLAMAGETGAETRSFQVFSSEYVGQVMKAYKLYRQKHMLLVEGEKEENASQPTLEEQYGHFYTLLRSRLIDVYLSALKAKKENLVLNDDDGITYKACEKIKLFEFTDPQKIEAYNEEKEFIESERFASRLSKMHDRREHSRFCRDEFKKLPLREKRQNKYHNMATNKAMNTLLMRYLDACYMQQIDINQLVQKAIAKRIETERKDANRTA